MYLHFNILAALFAAASAFNQTITYTPTQSSALSSIESGFAGFATLSVYPDFESCYQTALSSRFASATTCRVGPEATGTVDSLLADIEDTKWDIGFAQTQTAVAGAPKESLLVLLGDYLGVLEGAVAAATNGSWGNGTVAHPAAPGNVIVLSETSAAARMAFGRAGLLAGVVAGLLGAVVLL